MKGMINLSVSGGSPEISTDPVVEDSPGFGNLASAMQQCEDNASDAHHEPQCDSSATAADNTRRRFRQNPDCPDCAEPLLCSPESGARNRRGNQDVRLVPTRGAIAQRVMYTRKRTPPMSRPEMLATRPFVSGSDEVHEMRPREKITRATDIIPPRPDLCGENSGRFIAPPSCPGGGCG